MRWAIFPLLLLAGCAVAPLPKGSPSVRADVPPEPPAPRWRAVPARADGATVPGGRRHVVKRGETGIAIAVAYGVPWARIAEANRIGRDSVLEVGQALFIPTGPARKPAGPARPSRPPTPEERAAAFRIDVDDLITGTAEAGARPAPPPSAAPRPAPVPVAIPALSWPVDGRVILSGFGPKPGGRVNDGINIRALRGAPVRAAADGEILYVGDAIAGYGLMMLVRHGPPGPSAVVTAYGHLEDALLAKGTRVQRGQPIARAGSSGAAKEPQLLFQLRQGRRAIDPRPFLR